MLDTNRRDILATAAAVAAAPSALAAQPVCCPIVELRQYTLRDGQRDTLVELFDRAFIESQEATGMRVIGQFRDLDDPNRFVWLRGFDSMEARRKALTAFYTGPVWRAHREAANATMLDSDNVLLLRPLSTFDLALPEEREPAAGGSLVAATIHYLDRTAVLAFADFFTHEMAPRIEQAEARIAGAFATLHAPNSFPALPVREGESVLLWLARFEDERALDAFDVRLDALPDPRANASPEVMRQLMRKSERLRLAPTSRSLLR